MRNFLHNPKFSLDMRPLPKIKAKDVILVSIAVCLFILWISLFGSFLKDRNLANRENMELGTDAWVKLGIAGFCALVQVILVIYLGVVQRLRRDRKSLFEDFRRP